MNTRQIPAIIMLIAGLITCIVTAFQKVNTITFLTTLFMVLLVFYILGCIVKIVIERTINTDNKKDQEETSEEETEK